MTYLMRSSLKRSALACMFLLVAVSAHACVVEEGPGGVVSLDCQGDDVVLLYKRLAEAGGVELPDRA